MLSLPILIVEMPMPSHKHSQSKRLDADAALIVDETGIEASEALGEPDGEALSDFLRQMKDHNASIVRPSFRKRRERKAA